MLQNYFKMYNMYSVILFSQAFVIIIYNIYYNNSGIGLFFFFYEKLKHTLKTLKTLI